MSQVTSFLPQLDFSTRILVLGSMPGVQSLRQQQYYANHLNQFWRIIYSIFDAPLDQEYDKRLEFIKSKGIGLWDVLESCIRSGSLDSSIKSEKVNDFGDLLQSHPNIKYVLFNGTKAYEAFRKGIGFERFDSIGFFKLPSTSTANTEKFDQKLKEWTSIFDLISN